MRKTSHTLLDVVRINNFSEECQERFKQVRERADLKYDESIEAANRDGRFGFRHWLRPDQAQIVKEATELAALEYVGDVLFFFIEESSSEESPPEDLQLRVNAVLEYFREETLEHRWPRQMPAWNSDEIREQEFDTALIAWLESRDEWRKYETQILPCITIPGGAESPAAESRTPLEFCASWPLDQLSVPARRRIEAGLLEIHGAFLDDNHDDFVECWRLTFDLIAVEFHAGGRLSVELLKGKIVEMVADAAAGGGWSLEPLGRTRPTGVFNSLFGSQFYPIWRHRAFLKALDGRVAHWSGRLLAKTRTRAYRDTHPGQASPQLKNHRREIVKAFITAQGLDGMAGLARRVGSTESALQGMIRGDGKRYGEDRLNEVLKKIKCSRSKWDCPAKPRLT